MADNHFKINKGTTHAPQASAPSNPVDGDIYYDDSLNKFRAYENGVWIDVIGSPAATPDLTNLLLNVGISASAAAGALTINLRQKDGTSDPTAGDPSKVAFKSTTITNGGFTVQSYVAASSVVIPSTATMGFANGDNAEVYVWAIYDGSNLEIAVSGCGNSRFDESVSYNTTAISTGSDVANVLYSTTGRTAAQIKLIGRIKVNAITTAGTWTTPTSVIVRAGNNIDERADIIQSSTALTSWTPGSNVWANLTTIEVPPGEQDISAVLVSDVTADGNAGVMHMAISEHSGTTTTDHVVGDNEVFHRQGNQVSVTGTNSAYITVSIPKYRVVNSVTKTYYLKAKKNGGTLNQRIAYKISARKIK